MRSTASTVSEYLAGLPEDRRALVEAVRAVILANLDPKYSESMQYGAIGYAVPHAVFPAGYHCDPKQALPFAALANQKNHVSLHLMAIYGACEDGQEPPLAIWFREAWEATGKKLDLGKACVRFKRLEDVPLEVIGEAFRRVPAQVYIANYLAAMEKIANRPRTPRPQTQKPARQKASR